MQLPKDISATQLLKQAQKEGVTFSPGSNYFLDRAEGARYLRLNFATQIPVIIEAGIDRLGKTFQRLD